MNADFGSNIQKISIRHKQQVMQDHAKLIHDVEKTIRYQYELYQKMPYYLATKFPKFKKELISLADKRISISHGLYRQNFITIYTAYELILIGRIATSNILVRKIHESIVRQYYIGLCDEEAFTEYLELSQKNYSKLSRKDKIKLSHGNYKKELYDGAALKKMASIYSELSYFTHPTWSTILDMENYEKERIADSLIKLRTNSLFNVLSYCEVYRCDKNCYEILSV